MNNTKFCWVGVPFEFDISNGTYEVYKYKEHQIKDKYKNITSLESLKAELRKINIDSPTACYFDVDIKTGMFYRDQQDCIIWFLEKETGYVKTERERYVAKSLPEFLSHIEDDSIKWYSTFMQSVKKIIR